LLKSFGWVKKTCQIPDIIVIAIPAIIARAFHGGMRSKKIF